MTFNDFGGTKTTALTQDEMNAEAERILKRLDADGLPENITLTAHQFVLRKLGVVRAKGRLHVSIKELWWLRSINESSP